MERLFLFLTLATLSLALSEHPINKRVLPTNENCDPAEVCRKGDWIDRNIADCKYERSLLHFLTCDAQNDHLGSWIVDEAVGDRCKPSSGKRFTCGASGTSTRCVCSDTNIFYNPGPNKCKCQYWPPEDIGANSPAFCTGYYIGGTSGLHHWACCNNCDDPNSQSCDGTTWQGGSPNSYCGRCGQNNGGGREKYYFNCGNCDDQNTCLNFCNSKIGGILTKPGLCWVWLDCFKGCCLRIATQPRNKRDVSELSFCGDTVCSESETPSTCPADCCYQINSDNCTIRNNCTPECCQTSSCCLNNEDDDNSNNIDPSNSNNQGGNNLSDNDSDSNMATAIGVPMGVSILLIIASVVISTAP